MVVVYGVFVGVREEAVVSQVIIHVYPQDECYIATLQSRGAHATRSTPPRVSLPTPNAIRPMVYGYKRPWLTPADIDKCGAEVTSDQGLDRLAQFKYII